MGYPDHRAVGDRGMIEERGLDLDAVDVLATSDDHVLGPVHDVDEPLLVDAGHVAGVKPSMGEGRGRLGRTVPVAAHDVRPLDPELADPLGVRLLDRRLFAEVVVRNHRHVTDRRRRSHAVGLSDVVVPEVHRGHRGCFGQPVAVGRRPPGEVLLDPAHEIGRRRRTAVGDRFDRRGVAGREARRVEDLHHHGRHAAEDGDPLPLDQLQGPFRIEVVHHDQLPSGRGVGDEDGVAAGRVEERDRQQIGVLDAPGRVRRRHPSGASSRGSRRRRGSSSWRGCCGGYRRHPWADRWCPRYRRGSRRPRDRSRRREASPRGRARRPPRRKARLPVAFRSRPLDCFGGRRASAAVLTRLLRGDHQRRESPASPR